MQHFSMYLSPYSLARNELNFVLKRMNERIFSTFLVKILGGRVLYTALQKFLMSVSGVNFWIPQIKQEMKNLPFMHYHILLGIFINIH
jgi:hypothetical protein